MVYGIYGFYLVYYSLELYPILELKFIKNNYALDLIFCYLL